MGESVWPGDYGCAATFTFDLDADEIWRVIREGNSGFDTPPVATRGRFGPETAVPRILDLFETYDRKCTFFVPGKVAEDYPETVQAIHEAGHELGHHGYTHTNPAAGSREEEEAELKRAMDVFDDLVGETPTGYRSPAGDLSDHTLDLLADLGMVYESSFIDDDLPYVHETASGDLVEIPFSWALDDWPYFAFHMHPPLSSQSGITPAGPVFDGWTREYRGRRDRGRCFVLTMHPQLIGRAGRMDALERLLRTTVQDRDTWVTTCAAIADHWTQA